MDEKKDDSGFSFMDITIAFFLGGIIGGLIMALVMTTMRTP